MRTVTVALLAISLCILASDLSAAPTPQQVCEASTWANCGMAVQNALKANPTDPREILSLASAWAGAYDRRFDELRKNGKLEKSTPDAQKIFDEVQSDLNPADIALDKAIDAAAKRWLPRVAVLLEWAETPIGQALKTFFESSEIASDRDELDLMNESLQRRIATLLSPSLKPDWKQKLERATNDALPQLKP